MSELRDAAERLLRWAENHVNDPSATKAAKALIHDAGKVAIGYLALVPADGEEPVTEEFVKSLNPPRYWEAGREYSWPTVQLRFAVSIGSSDGAARDGWYIDGRVGPHYLSHITTRGHVRRLLTDLGIPLPGDGK